MKARSRAVNMFAPLALLLTFESPVAAAPADMVVRKANLITMDTNQPRAQAFAVEDGRFVFVGNDDGVERFIGPKTLVLELTGKTVTPGFIAAPAPPAT